jgi:hypothetical protein
VTVAIYVGKNKGARSLAVMANDLAKAIPGGKVVSKFSDLAGADKVLNLVIEDLPRIEKARRFMGMGKQVCLFASGVREFPKSELIGLLANLEKVDIVVHSKYHYDDVVGALGVFAPAFRKELLKKLHFIQGGITKEFESTAINDKLLWMVPFNYKNEGTKAIGLHSEVSAKLATAIEVKHKQKVRHRFYVIEEESVEALVKEYPMYEVGYCPKNRMDYVQNARQTGLFICTSNHESLGLMYLELLASGAVGVFLDKPWVRQLLPDYKLVVARENLESAVLKVYEEYQKASTYVHDKVIPFIDAHRRADKFEAELISLLESV